MVGGSAVFGLVSNIECRDEKEPLVQVNLLNGWIKTQAQRQTRKKVKVRQKEWAGVAEKQEVNGFHSQNIVNV